MKKQRSSQFITIALETKSKEDHSDISEGKRHAIYNIVMVIKTLNLEYGNRRQYKSANINFAPSSL